MNQFTICALLYGDYPHLAARCLPHLVRLADAGAAQLRIGANEISTATREVLRFFGAEKYLLVDLAENRKKYPVMRELFGFGEKHEIRTEYIMWFDDDSFLKVQEPEPWLRLVEDHMRGADMIGAIYHQGLIGNQAKWIEAQPWYTGKKPGKIVNFCQGAWWTARTKMLKQFRWPIPELLHRGGDVMLGELCRQQNLRMRLFRDGVAINADKDGKESRSKKRGFDSMPIGHDFVAPLQGKTT